MWDDWVMMHNVYTMQKHEVIYTVNSCEGSISH